MGDSRPPKSTAQRVPRNPLRDLYPLMSDSLGEIPYSGRLLIASELTLGYEPSTKFWSSFGLEQQMRIAWTDDPVHHSIDAIIAQCVSRKCSAKRALDRIRKLRSILKKEALADTYVCFDLIESALSEPSIEEKLEAFRVAVEYFVGCDDNSLKIEP